MSFVSEFLRWCKQHEAEIFGSDSSGNQNPRNLYKDRPLVAELVRKGLGR